MTGFNTITVLDYAAGQVRVFSNVYTEDALTWLKEHDKYWHDDSCYYMYGKDTEVVYV